MTNDALTPEDWGKHLRHEAGNKRMGESEVGLGVYAYHDSHTPDNGVTELIAPDELLRPLLVMQWDSVNEMEIIHDPHRLAALCLHRQSFGFSHDDVKVLREVIQGAATHPWQDAGGQGETLSSIADRIAALLPPA